MVTGILCKMSQGQLEPRRFTFLSVGCTSGLQERHAAQWAANNAPRLLQQFAITYRAHAMSAEEDYPRRVLRHLLPAHLRVIEE